MTTGISQFYQSCGNVFLIWGGGECKSDRRCEAGGRGTFTRKWHNITVLVLCEQVHTKRKNLSGNPKLFCNLKVGQCWVRNTREVLLFVTIFCINQEKNKEESSRQKYQLYYWDWLTGQGLSSYLLTHSRPRAQHRHLEDGSVPTALTAGGVQLHVFALYSWVPRGMGVKTNTPRLPRVPFQTRLSNTSLFLLWGKSKGTGRGQEYHMN